MKKTDQFHSLTKWVDYNRYKVLSVLLAIVMVWGVASCESKTVSSMDGVTKLTRQQFVLEQLDIEAMLADQLAQVEAAQAAYNRNVEAHNAKLDAGMTDLERQDQFKAKLLEVGGGMISAYATGNPIEAASVISSLLALGGIGLAVGSVADGKRKDAHIKENKDLSNND